MYYKLLFKWRKLFNCDDRVVNWYFAGKFNKVRKYLKKGHLLNVTTFNLLQSEAKMSKNAYELFQEYEKTQKSIISRGRHEEIMLLVQNYYLTDGAGVQLVGRGNHDEIMACLHKENTCVSDAISLAVVNRGNKEEIEYLLRNCYLDTEAFKALLSRGDQTEIVCYLSRGCYMLGEESELDLLTRGQQNEIRAYIYHNSLHGEECEEMFINNCDDELIDYYLQHHDLLHDKGQEALFKRGDHTQIMAFLATHRVNEKAFRVLLERGQHEEIMAYLAKWPVDEELQVMLINRRISSEITAMVKHPNWRPGKKATMKLVARGDRDELYHAIYRQKKK